MILSNTEPHGRLDLEHEAVGGTAFQQAAVGAHRNAVAPNIVEIVQPEIHLIVLITRYFQEFGIIPQHGMHPGSVFHVFPIGVQKIVIEPHIFFQTLLLFRKIGAQTDLRMHMVEIVLDAVAVFLAVVILRESIKLRTHPIRRITVKIGQLVVITNRRIQSIILENAVEEEI